jgi:cytochrome P450
MQLLTEMALPYLPADQPEFDRDPMPFVAAARRQHPWMAKFSEGYFVHGYQAVKDFSAMDDKLAPSYDGVAEFYGAQDTAWGEFMRENINAIGGERHTRIRNSIAHAFTPRAINQFRALMADRISDLLDEWAPRRKFDFADFAANFPISVMCALLGTSASDVPRIRAALEAQGMVNQLKRDLAPELLAGHDVMESYVNDLIAEREERGPIGDGGLLDALIAAKGAGQIDAQELRHMLIFLFPAGFDTSKNMFTLTTYMLLQRPSLWQRCAAEKDFCAKVLDEMFRYSSTATVFRTVTDDFSYDGVRFPKGARLFLGNGVAGRDPTVFGDADKFDPERQPTSSHVAFGRGMHICIGRHLARTQIIEGLHVVTRRLTNARLAGEVTWRGYLGAWGPRTLPIEFEPA